MEKLTLQEKKFITEYIKTLDSENAVKKAGYKEKNLLKVAEKILSKDYIVKELNLQLKQRVNALNITKGYVVKKLLQIAEFSLEEEEITDLSNPAVVLKYKTAADIVNKALKGVISQVFLFS